MKSFFEMFPFSFHLYGLIVGLGISVAVMSGEYLFKKEKIQLNFNAFIGTVLISSLIGARAYHLLTDWQLYQHSSLIDLLAVWNGGIGIIGAFIGGCIAIGGFLFFQKKMRLLMPILDVLALSLPFAQAIGRWGNYFNQELYGSVTSLPWGLQIDSAHLIVGLSPDRRYHPLFFYESILMIICGIILWNIYRSRERVRAVGSGKYLSFYLMYYSVVRFMLEFLRIQSSRVALFPLNILTTAQWMMVGVFIIGAVLSILTHTGKLRRYEIE